MYAVIFKAYINELDSEYELTAEKMRELALTKYGCTEFTSACEGQFEIAVSYWPSLEAIAKWKQVAEHLIAQDLGKTKWYSKYEVQVTKVVRSYASAT